MSLERVRAALLPAAVAIVVRLIGATLRLRIVGSEEVAPFWRQSRAVIYVVWHGRILLIPWLSARLHRSHGARRPVVLTSLSRDGDLLARFVGSFGLSAIRGSSSRGGEAGLHELIAAVRRGVDVAIVPDGPRGPSEQLQPGVVMLAAVTGAPVVPLAVSARPCRRLSSWDRFLVPWPFARSVLVFGPAIHVERTADRTRAAKELERALAEVTGHADALAAGASAS
jgi:lysophospholipid acyltransferase (LPLAT)-like uncharacterized protein